MQLAEFPIGAVVELQSGGGKLTVVDNEPDSAGHIRCACFANGVQYARLPPMALHPCSPWDSIATAELPVSEQIEIGERSTLARNKAGVETLREAFKLRTGCDRIDHAAEDAAAEYRAYREQSAVDERLEQSEALQRWRDAAASYPDAAARLAEGLRANGQDGDLRACARAADLLEAFAR